MPNLSGALEFYSKARDYVVAAGLEYEVSWQRSANINLMSESVFLREAAWVVLCSGFRESVIRSKFNYISLCFCDWESAHSIVRSDPACILAAQAAFRSVPKLSAIVEIARYVDADGFETVKQEIIESPIEMLQRFPFIGPVTVWHLAKNLGVDVSKPDRHLVRIAEKLDFDSAEHLCTSIAQACGESAKVIDIVVWRYLADGGIR